MKLKEAENIFVELDAMTPTDRVDFFRDPRMFKLFWYYYFINNFITDLAPFHDNWIRTLAETNSSMLIESFRGSLKTELIKVYLVYCICYNIEPYIVIQSYDSTGSEEMVRNVAKMLVSRTIVRDFGNLFPFETSKEEFNKKSVFNFNTTNGVKVVAKSLGEKLRGAVSYDEETGSARPTLLILDDIDVIDAVRNQDIINKNEQKINNETIGAMSKEKARIIFLGNTILGDGIVRRFYNNKRSNPHWKVIRQPIYNELGEIVWDFFTPEKIEKIKADEGQDAFEQNYLLIPKVLAGLPVFDTTQEFKIMKPRGEIEGFKIFLDPTDELVIGVDLSEGGEDGDFSSIVGRKRNGQVAFTYKARVNEVILAQKMDFILNYDLNGRRYQGVIFPENNTGLAFINECKKYKWFQYMLKQRSVDDVEEDIKQKYGFRTTTQSKDLIIREYKMALYKGEIWITDDILKEITTYQYDRNNRPNALRPDHDDLLMADMIAYNGILHENWVVKYKVKDTELEDMGHLERLKARIQRGDFQ